MTVIYNLEPYNSVRVHRKYDRTVNLLLICFVIASNSPMGLTDNMVKLLMRFFIQHLECETNVLLCAPCADKTIIYKIRVLLTLF